MNSTGAGCSPTASPSTSTRQLAPLLVGKNLSVIYVTNSELSGFFRLDKDQNSGFLVINTVGDTLET